MRMHRIANLLKRLTENELGNTAVEYAILGALIAAIIVIVVHALGIEVQSLFCRFMTAFGTPC